MNDNRASTDTGITQEAFEAAEGWLLRLSEPDCPAAEREAFARWCAAQPMHVVAYQHVERLWALGGEAVADPAVMAAAQRALRFEDPPARPWRRWALPAGALAVASLLVFVVLPRWRDYDAPPPGIAYATRVGELREIVLADGSTVKLDTATRLVERYSGGERRMDLQSGQAQFKVQGNPARPFVVYANGGAVTATGTEFQVRAQDDRTDVTLLEGRVEVATRPQHGAGARAELRAGQRLTYDRQGGISAPQPVDERGARAWTEGRLRVHDWRLQDLLNEMNRYAALQLQLEDPGLADVRISGTFRTGDQDTLAQVLAQGWDIEMQRRSASEAVLRRR